MVRIFETQDGSSSVYSEALDVGYHSKYGAIRESRHVFIESGLFFKAIAKKNPRILEMGFGTGLNAFLTCLEADRLSLQVDYVAVDNFPLDPSLLARLNYPTLLQAAGSGSIFQKIHAVGWGETHALTEHFQLKKVEKPFEELTFTPEFDLIYFDAFAPNVQPQLWEAQLLQVMFDALLPGGILVTYCAKGAFKRVLKSVGFTIETLKGPPGKREMTRAIKY
ncbi:MAG: tRNA (5-methylaminomethyl-2-thiouridine)(34)-methyltransferase MnmD [Lewinellaceae bacterium]|nr:tRNA (5-methylaminomethyl-2-thiouridine)(34)-methyltransferase MnmD [Saprospiraceae bacterium]MCB9339269.1 tRNA (5-methylaminomethyl-2-thiouridine)(34)-methyltransferase MnmD [Lewinellaceae bacterium]